MDICVAEVATTLPLEEVGHPGHPPVDLDEPGMVLEIESVPLLAEVGRGPVRVAGNGALGRSQDGQRLLETVAGWSHDVHRCSVRPVDRADGAARRTLAYGCVVEPFLIRTLVPGDWADVARIYAGGLATGLASFETRVPSWDEWDAGHREAPRLAAELDGALVGWAAVASVSPRDCYRGVVEHSVYVDLDARGRGIGRALLLRLLAEAPEHGIWTIQTSIIAGNTASLALHESVGFRVVGRRERIAQRDGVWHDTVLLEFRLP